MKKRSLPLSKVYRLIETGPVMLLTTAGKERPDVMTLAWHTMLDFTPPLVGCVAGEQSLTFNALLKRRECVLNIPTRALGTAVTGCGSTSGRDTDKFKTFGLTPKPAALVAAPLIEECFASFECKVVDTRMARRYNLFVLEVVKAWADPAVKDPETLHHRGGDAFMVAGPTVQIASKKK